MSRSMFAEATCNGMGFGLGFAVSMNPAQMLIAGSPGEYSWGGAAGTACRRKSVRTWLDSRTVVGLDIHTYSLYVFGYER